MKTKAVVVSPDLVPAASGPSDERVDEVSVQLARGASERVVFLPMAEWKQCVVRATRATAPALVVLSAGGTAASAATNSGLPPLLMVGLPSTGIFIVDTFVICLLIWVIWLLWNAGEFYFDVDENHPKARA